MAHTKAQKQATQAGKTADELHAQHYGTPPVETPPVETPPVDTPPVEAPALVILDAPPIETPPVDTPPVETPPVVLEEDPKWEQRYKSLQGKYSAEVPRLNDQVKTLKAQLEAQTVIVTGLQSQVANPATVPTHAAITIPQDVIDEYGEDVVHSVAAVVRDQMSGETQTLRDELNGLKDQMGSVVQTTARTARDRLVDDLTREVPNWRTTNENAEFIGWLAMPDALSGQLRQDLLDGATASNDGLRVIAIFQSFERENAALTPSPTPPVVPQPPSVNPDTLIAPGGGINPGSPPSQEPQSRMWKASEIAQHYTDVRNGVFRGREAEKRATEQEFIDASKEGRVIPNQ